MLCHESYLRIGLQVNDSWLWNPCFPEHAKWFISQREIFILSISVLKIAIVNSEFIALFGWLNGVIAWCNKKKNRLITTLESSPSSSLRVQLTFLLIRDVQHNIHSFSFSYQLPISGQTVYFLNPKRFLQALQTGSSQHVFASCEGWKKRIFCLCQSSVIYCALR